MTPNANPKKPLLLKRLLSAALAVAMSVSVMTSTFSGAYAVTQSQINSSKEKIEQMEAEKEYLENRMDAIEAELEDLKDKEADAIDTLLALQEQILALEEQIDNTIELIEQYEIRIEETTQELNDAIAEEERYYQLYLDRVRAMEEVSPVSYWSALLTADSFSELLDRINTITDIMNYDKKIMAQLEEARQKVADTKARLEEEKAQLEDEKALLEEQQAELQDAYAAADAALQEIHDNQEAYADKLAEYADMSEELAEDIVTEEANYQSLLAQYAEEERRRQEALQQQQNQNNGSSNNGSGTISSAQGSELGKAIANYGCQFIGNPYVWGGESLTNGADCSGFVVAVYRHFGYSLPHSSLMLRSCGTEVSYADAQPGDVVFYFSSGSPTGGHCGIYIGNGMMVNALSAKYGIVISNVNPNRSGLTFRRII